MIVIKITNARDIVRGKKGRFISNIAPLFVDLETKVEEAIVRQIEDVFKKNNIEAVITIVKEE